MKQLVPFTKDIKFNTKIYEITSISLENTFTIEEDNTVNGEFIVSGEYKMNDSSINTEPFIYSLPFDIDLDKDYETEKIKVDIDDFNFEIINESILRANIKILIQATKKEEITPDVIIETRKEEKEDNMEEEINLFEEKEEITPVIKEEINISNLESDNEEFVSYFVHIVRENDTLESICTKYGVTDEDLKEYNNIDEITLGNKIIVPYISEKL